MDGHGIQTDARPKQERLVVAQTHVHAIDGGVRKQARILLQGAVVQPVEGLLAQFHGPDVHRTGREDGQRRFGVDESAGDLTDGAIAANGKDRIIFFQQPPDGQRLWHDCR